MRERFSADRLFAVGSGRVAAGLVAPALLREPAAAVALSFVIGVNWLFCLSTLNVASQELLGWVCARGLALYLTAISAGIAVGSALWGWPADATGAPVA